VSANEKISYFFLGEPSPPSIHGQPSSGKSFKISITKQDDGGAPILEYIVKYRSVSII
jgi:neural cell adhesion molecule